KLGHLGPHAAVRRADLSRPADPSHRARLGLRALAVVDRHRLGTAHDLRVRAHGVVVGLFWSTVSHAALIAHLPLGAHVLRSRVVCSHLLCSHVVVLLVAHEATSRRYSSSLFMRAVPTASSTIAL